MTKNEITVGGIYLAKVSGKVVKVRVDHIYNQDRYGKRDASCYDVTNLTTGKKTTFRSAAKFRSAVKEPRHSNYVPSKQGDAAYSKDRQDGQSNEQSAVKAQEKPAIASEAVKVSQDLSGNKVPPNASQGLTSEDREADRSEVLPGELSVAKPELSDRLSSQPAKRVPTAEQQAIIEAAKRKQPVLVVVAGAGAGKTSTLRMIGDALEGNGQYTAFNSSLVNESKEKFEGTNVACNTTHSLGFRAVGKAYSHRLGGQRIKSYQVAAMLGIKNFEVEVQPEQGTGKDKVPAIKKSLNAGYLAGQVLGAVKRFCQSADREVEATYFRYIDGIDLPSELGRTFANNGKVREYLLPFARKAWDDLASTDGQLPFSHDHYVKIWQLNKPIIAGDYVLLDECFPAGTIIETDKGKVEIEEIANGSCRVWSVLTSFNGGKMLHYTRVTSAYKTPKSGPLVRIQHAKDTIVCTANHPIWIKDKGWTAAGLVCRGDSLSYLPESYQETLENMQPSLRIEMEGSQQIAGSGEVEERENIQTNETGLVGNTQSSFQAGSEGKDFGNTQSKRNYLHSEGRKRYGTDSTTANVVRRASVNPTTLAMEPRACRIAWTTKEGLSNELQSGYRQPSLEDSDRSGWQEPSKTQHKDSRRQEGYSTVFSRVESVEVLESGSRGEFEGRSTEDCEYVYTLSVESGCYFANGVLVKNCQDTAPVMLDIIKQQRVPVILVGDSSQAIYEWRGAVDALGAFPNAPRLMLSQSFRFGVAIAEVANAVLDTLDTPTDLRIKGLPSIPSTVSPVAEPTAILCRSNALAVSTVLSSIADGKRPFLVGGGSDVISFVEAALALQTGESTNHPDLACFGSWLEVQEYTKLDEGDDLKLMVKLIDSFGCQTILSALRGMPIEKEADLVISTAHKSKGREWDHVKLGSDFPTRSKSSDSDKRLLYVAVTRAKLTLDVATCPFFTGQDALDISEIGNYYRDKVASNPEISVILPTPSISPLPQEFTWAKGKQDNQWLVRGPVGNSGKMVDVVRKNGSKASHRLGKTVWRNNEVALYEV